MSASEIRKEIGRQSSLEAVSNMEGGKLVIASVKKDILSSIDEVATKYKTASHSDLIAIGAKLATNLAMYRVLMGASKRKKIAIKDLEEFLKENPEE